MSIEFRNPANNFYELAFVENNIEIFKKKVSANNFLIFKKAKEIIEQNNPGKRWYYNHFANREWGYGPVGLQNDNVNHHHKILWIYPYRFQKPGERRRDSISIWLSSSFFDHYFMDYNAFENNDLTFHNWTLLGYIFGYRLYYRLLPGTDPWILMDIDSDEKLEELIVFLSDII